MGTPLRAQHEVLKFFLNSQHRTIIVEIGIYIPVTNSLPKPRWNFRKAKWEAYMDHIEKTCTRIQPNQANMVRINMQTLTGAKKHIPRWVRKQYIHCWTLESENPLREYEETGDQDFAEQLLNSLQDVRRNRWVQSVESMNFTRSSRQACRLLDRLDWGGNQDQGTYIDPDRIAKNIIQRGSHVKKISVWNKYKEKISRALHILELCGREPKCWPS